MFVQLLPEAACLSGGRGELAESQPASRELSALQDTTERLQKEVLPLGYWNFIIPDQNDDLKDLVQDDYASGKQFGASTR